MRAPKLILTGAAATAVLLTSCSSSDNSAATKWAGDVCSAYSDLATSAGTLKQSVKIDSNSSQSTLEQTKQQVEQNLSDVKSSAQKLKTTVEDAPSDLNDDVKQAQSQLKTSADRAKASIDGVGQAASGLASANGSGLATQLGIVGVALAGASSDVKSFISQLKNYVSSSKSALKDAFGSADSCKSLSKG